MTYQHLRIMYHAEAVMAAVILRFLSVHVCRRGFFSPGEENRLLFFFLCMHRKTYSPEIWEPCLAYILGCVCNDPEYETTYSGFFPFCIFTKDIFVGQQKIMYCFKDVSLL